VEASNEPSVSPTVDPAEQQQDEYWWFSDKYYGVVPEQEVDNAEPYLLFYEQL
jgi:hypothetical protein